MKSGMIILAGVLMSVICFGQNSKAYQAKVVAPGYTDDFYSSIGDLLEQNIEYPVQAKQSGMQGVEVIRFVVSPNGKISNFKIISSVTQDIDRDLLNILRSTSGRWNPGRINGLPCPMEKEVVVVYKLHKSTDLHKIAAQDFRKANFLMYDKNDPRKALRFYNRAAGLMPKDIPLIRARMVCRSVLGDAEGALADRQRMDFLAGDAENISSEVVVMME